MRIITLIIFVIAGIWVALNPVAADISLSLHEAKILLAGGEYVKDFFEINPPLYLYLYMPAIIAAKLFSMNLFLAFQLYIFALIAGSLYVCGSLDTLFVSGFVRVATNPAQKKRIQATMLAFILLILPTPLVFGQREHLLLIFSLPYLFLLARRLENRKIKPYFAVLIGLFAGIGFAIKPFFCLTIVLLEIYYLLDKKKWSACFRPEVLAIASVMIIYLLSILLLHQGYLNVVMPLAMRLYYQGFRSELSALLCLPSFVTVLICILLFVISRKYDSNKKTTNVFFIAMIGFAVAYLMQQLNWYYHVYPAYALAVILTIYFCNLLIKRKIVNGFILLILVLIMPLVQAIYCVQEISFWQQKQVAIRDFIQKKAYQKPIYFLTTSLKVEYPVIDYAGAIPSSIFPSLWWLSGYLKQMHSIQLEKDKNYFLDTIANELKTNKPVLVFVQMEKNLNLVQFFSQNKNFAIQWKNYRYLMDIQEKDYYHLSVFERY